MGHVKELKNGQTVNINGAQTTVPHQAKTEAEWSQLSKTGDGQTRANTRPPLFKTGDRTEALKAFVHSPIGYVTGRFNLRRSKFGEF